MDKRILLNDKFRREVFSQLKEFHKAGSYRELSSKLGVNYSGFRKWLDGYNYIPLKIFPKNFLQKKFIVDIKDEGWGRSKAGKIGIKRLREIYPLKVRRKWSIKGGKNNIKNLGRIRKLVDGKKIKSIKIRKRRNLIKNKIKQNVSFFQNNSFPFLKTKDLIKSKNDEINNLSVPEIFDENLAEETGIHIGDGTLSKRRNYYSIRGFSKDEHDYYRGHIANLIEKVYGFKPKIFNRGSVCGFEKCSRLLFEFKTKLLNIPYGEKSHIVDIPNVIKNSKNEKLISAFIRGILDSDGCIWFSKNGTYPRIELASVSKKLIKSLEFYLKKMGFEPCINKKKTKITLYGEPMLDLWLNKIGTNHPKHKLKIIIWKKFDKCPPRLSYPELKKLSEAPVV